MTDTVQQLTRFCLVGGGGLFINVFVTHLGVTLLGWWYFSAYLVATIISWSIMFVANAFFTFPTHDHGTYSQKYLLFVSGYGVVFCIHAALVYAFTSYAGIYYVWSIVGATALTTILTFTFSKHVIYKP